jgi:hypothetical protein
MDTWVLRSVASVVVQVGCFGTATPLSADLLVLEIPGPSISESQWPQPRKISDLGACAQVI